MNSSQRRGKITHTTEVLQWMDFNVELTGHDGTKGESFFMREELECTELCHQMDDELAETLWVRIRGRTKVGDIGGCVSAAEHRI